ncbi:nucleotidyl transferase AbiEii/AbiGii toxin family protein [Streptomyces liangshanensis]|uniref:Nucleotidyl transferase AbiEii/AbiGii toxin family protein n=1 Tax=Streptomyces liangshanensis TaxID=2717324 RepID=A0A6G9H8V9_9ACTN|nr:nucleotidyl transferase AbiEii/AbiGii toxin family protein [Streptomyces liangshanensis]QIQ06930.1 nucleotidyl transferase AbiEii/AbiGii toxin family protein [Streptomyces liangshanensis]
MVPLPWEPLASDVPRTLLRVMGAEAIQKAVFDPALKQFPDAFRASDPLFPTLDATRAWQTARSAALSAVRDGVAASPWAPSLVLRGSVLMALWFGEQAREPGDLDFVVVPASWRMDEERTSALLAGVAAAAEAGAAGRADGVRIDASGAVCEDIWTYERVPGRRMMLPWHAPETPGGWIQLDFVFGESLPEPSEPVDLPSGAVLYGATPALSLAWKVMWLVNDMHAQGKDLYDAVLLAERYALPNTLLQEVFRVGGEWPVHGRERVLGEDVAEALGFVEWSHFAGEYPRFAGREGEFVARLCAALERTFADGPGDGDGDGDKDGDDGVV